MSLPEIKQSLFNDYKLEIKSKMEAIKMTCKAKWVRNGRKDFAETLAFAVKSRNNWRVSIFCRQNAVSNLPYLIAYDKPGVTASQIHDMPDEHLMHFNSHFLNVFVSQVNLILKSLNRLSSFFLKKIKP